MVRRIKFINLVTKLEDNIIFNNKIIANIEEEINIYNNIEESTIKIKEEYFNTISKLEQDIINGSSNKKLLI